LIYYQLDIKALLFILCSALHGKIRMIKAGYEIKWEEVKAYAYGGTGVYKQHIMHALLHKSYTDQIYGALYNVYNKAREFGEVEGFEEKS
jgi:hypothetical protein